jgi:DNA repair protein RadA/Sms
MTKARLQYVCQACGYASPKWLGRCPACEAWNSFVEEVAGEVGSPPPAPPAVPVAMTEVVSTSQPRMATGSAELDRVLGGGLVPGSLVLIGGDPGIGKTTLLTQACRNLAEAGRLVLYVSGEESAAQVKLRADRLGVATPNLLLLAEANLEAILGACKQEHPQVVVVDSIQTVVKPGLSSAPGSVGQVRECTADLMRMAKDHTICVLIVGHVTKEGQLAGPRVLEHIVDTVLYFEGDRHHAYRIIRATKNRFGSTNEIGVFEMRETGLRDVLNPSAAFLSERAAEAPGSAVVCAMEGTRPLLVEVQALVTPTVFGMPRRTVAGVDYNRTVVLLAVLEKRAGTALASHDVYVSVAGGVNVDEPAIDLGVAAAVASSLRGRPVDPTAVAIGEIGLGGELRMVPQLEKRALEAARLGFRRCIVPAQGAELQVAGIELIPVSQVASALQHLIP